jgi:hypothetical protein
LFAVAKHGPAFVAPGAAAHAGGLPSNSNDNRTDAPARRWSEVRMVERALHEAWVGWCIFSIAVCLLK